MIASEGGHSLRRRICLQDFRNRSHWCYCVGGGFLLELSCLSGIVDTLCFYQVMLSSD